MTKFLPLCAILVVFLSPVYASAETPTPSLFFTAEETRKIEALAHKEASTPGASDIHLGAIMYYAPNDWAVWLQGERWTPTTEHTDLHILGVEPNQVRMELSGVQFSVPQDITLRPYQTYQTATGKIVEGAE